MTTNPLLRRLRRQRKRLVAIAFYGRKPSSRRELDNAYRLARITLCPACGIFIICLDEGCCEVCEAYKDHQR